MRVRRIASCAVFALSTVALSAQEPTPRPQFKAGVELFQLDVTVLDGKRLPVRGLKEADFTVLINGIATPIRAFTPIEIAAPRKASEAIWAAEAPPDVVTNQVGEQEGRLVVILLDRSIPVNEPIALARRIATAAVEALGPHDLAAVVSTRNNAVQDGSVQNFTADRARLLGAINRMDPSTGISKEAEQLPTVGKQDPGQDGRCLCGVCVAETIQRVAEALQNTPRRRKVLLFIGSSVIWQSARLIAESGQDVSCGPRLEDARNAMFAAVDLANVTVHAIDPQGLMTIGPQTRAGAISQPNGSVVGGRNTSGGTPAMAGGPGTRLGQLHTELNESITNKQNLDVLPARTGGRTIVGANNADQMVPSIFRESEAYYVLAIERPVSNRPDEPRSIEVRVARKDVRVHTQRKYAPAQVEQSNAGPPASNADAIGRLVPSAVRPLALGVVAAANLQGDKAVVRVNLDARAFARSDGTPVPLDVSIVAVDRVGRSVASASQKSTIQGGVAGGDRNSATPDVNIQSYVELDPGDYEIRAAVSNPAEDTVASVFADVTIPKFQSATLSLSDIAVEIASGPTTSPLPTTRRGFRRGDTVRAVIQIYQGTQRTDPLVPVSMRVQIVNAKGTVVRDQSLPFAEQAFTNRRADAVITLPIANLAPGEYLLRLDAAAHRQTSGRALRFSVE
jgi:VWFA-related protein